MRTSPSALAALAVLIFVCACSPGRQSGQKEEENKPFTMDLLVGTYTGQGSEGIYRLEYNPETGELSDTKLVAPASNPSYLATSKNKQFVYAVNEDDPGGLTAFRWNAEKDTLELLNQWQTEGAHPCYIDMGPGDETVAVANYSSGNLAVFNVNNSGELQGPPQVRQHEGSGPVESRQQGPHAHCSVFKENFLYVVDLGNDKIMSYPIGADGKIGEGQVAFSLQPGDGPRHLVFHTSRNKAYVANELSNTVVALTVDHTTGTMQQIARLSTLPDDFEEESYVADIHLAPNGKFLYVSNRGHNSLAIFSVSAEDGGVAAVGHEPVRGDWPRNFCFSADGKFLLVANQKSDNIVVFKVDKETGLLSFSGHEAEVSQPVCLRF